MVPSPSLDFSVALEMFIKINSQKKEQLENDPSWSIVQVYFLLKEQIGPGGGVH